MMTFRILLRRLKKSHYASTSAFAKALNVDPSHLSRAMGPSGQPFDVRGCLRLAKVTGTDPGTTLRAAGKGEIAELIEALYGTPTVAPPPDQQELLRAYQAIAPHARQSLIVLARAAGSAAKRDDDAAAHHHDDRPVRLASRAGA